MSNKYTYNSNQNHSASSAHSRAATYAKQKQPAYKKKQTPSSHSSSNSVATTSNATLNDIETTRSDMRDILWQNAELLQSDPNYRKKVWRYMSKVFYGNHSSNIQYNFDHFRKFQLPATANTYFAQQKQNKNKLNVLLDKQKENKNKDFNIMTGSKLKLLLDREETYSDFLINSNPNQVILMNKVRPKMESILSAYACANDNKFGLSGAVQLCAVILTTFSVDGSNEAHSNSDCQDTFFILQILTQIMRPYYAADCKLQRDETLLLIDVLCVNEDKLVRKLNNLCIDVIDLSVFVTSWIGSLFVDHFEIEFVQRVIDLVLLEGPSVLIAVVYGILLFIKNDILQCDTHYDVFEKLAGQKLRNYLRKHEFIHRVISKAQLLFTEENYKYVIKGREKKSWTDLLGLPGQKHFRITKGVGDKTKVKKAYQHWRRESRKNITNAYLGAEESTSDDSSDGEEEHPRMHHATSSSFGFNAHENSSGKLKEMELKLQAANETISRLQSCQSSAALQLDEVEEALPSLNTMIEHNDSVIVKSEASLGLGANAKNEHKKGAKTLSELLYTSSYGDEIYREPEESEIDIREIQCRTENWTDSWKNAINSLTDASISMQGYLCKMTASKWNSRGTLDKIQRRWFVLRGNYMTYYKTNLHTQPKSDKCVNLLNYKVNPIKHAKSKYAFELISSAKQNLHKKSQSVVLERTKFILIPDLDVAPEKQKGIRDKWVKSLRLATKGAFLWDVLLAVPVNANASYHSYRDRGRVKNSQAPSGQNQTAAPNSPKQHSNSPKNTYNRRQYKKQARVIGGNTQDYPDYAGNSQY